jgi:hypothetical protein
MRFIPCAYSDLACVERVVHGIDEVLSVAIEIAFQVPRVLLA